MILVNDPFDQSSKAQISSTCFICSRVIIQKSVSRILQGFLYSWLCLSELTTPSMQEFLIICLLGSCSVLSEFSLPRIFWPILGKLVCIWHLSNSTAEGQHHAMQGFVLYYGFQHYGFLWISSALVHSLIEVLLIVSPSQLTLYYSEWVSLLKF